MYPTLKYNHYLLIKMILLCTIYMGLHRAKE